MLRFPKSPDPVQILTLIHIVLGALDLMLAWCHDRYSSTFARFCRSDGYQWSGVLYLRLKYKRMAVLTTDSWKSRRTGSPKDHKRKAGVSFCRGGAGEQTQLSIWLNQSTSECRLSKVKQLRQAKVFWAFNCPSGLLKVSRTFLDVSCKIRYHRERYAGSAPFLTLPIKLRNEYLVIWCHLG